MCGIAGFIGQFSEEQLSQMGKAIAHRGPDGHGMVYRPRENFGCVHRRLAIIDISSNGLQPMWSANERYIIVFNGEIYNFRDLRRQLEAKGRKFRSSSDTEVLVEGFDEWGEAILERLIGMFAFAVWDVRERRLFLARDGFGVKPLYLFSSPEGFAFASEIKALCCLGAVEKGIDWVAMAQYVSFMYSIGTRTPLKAVRKLRPGEAAWVDASGKFVRMWRYEPPPSYHEDQSVSIGEWNVEIASGLDRAVGRQMVADVPVGTFLSGGLDSSLITSFARQYTLAGKLRSFTIGFDESYSSREGVAEDLPYARQVAQHLGVDLNVVWAKPVLAGDFERAIYHLDEPQGDPAAMNAMAIARDARANGIKVLLSGAGGDDLFSGYRRHVAVSMEKYVTWLPTSVRHAMNRLAGMSSKRLPLLRRIARAMQDVNLDNDSRLIGYFSWIRLQNCLAAFSPDIRSSIDAGEVYEEMRESLKQLDRRTSPLNRMLYLDMQYFLPDHNLNYTDKMSMAEGVEVRVPFLDPDLARIASRIPVNYKQNGLVGKWILKQAAQPYLPPEVIYRPKTGFGVPLRGWLDGELAGYMKETLSHTGLQHRGVFDAAVISEMMARNRSGAEDSSYPLFAIMCVETWFRVFCDEKRWKAQVAGGIQV